MARSNRLVKPVDARPLRLEVRRTERLSPHFLRVTFGGGDIAEFTPLGFDQWFRIFLPLGGDEALARIPAKANQLLGYMKYLRIPDGERPVMRNYSVRAYRERTDAAEAELDVDFALHGSTAEGTAGPATRWAERASVGENVVIIDEGLGFNPARGVEQVLLVADETGLPVVSSIAASLPAHAIGRAIIEVPTRADALAFERPEGLEVCFVDRGGDATPTTPGVRALADVQRLLAAGFDPAHYHAFVVGEQSLPAAARRLLIAAGGDKERISFVGYWRAGTASPTPRAQRSHAR